MSESIYDRKTRDVGAEIAADRSDRMRERNADKRLRDNYYAANFPDSPLAPEKKVIK